MQHTTSATSQTRLHRSTEQLNQLQVHACDNQAGGCGDSHTQGRANGSDRNNELFFRLIQALFLRAKMGIQFFAPKIKLVRLCRMM